MSGSMKRNIGVIAVFLLGLFQASSVLARSDDFMQREIEAKIAESASLRGIWIEIHVE